MQISDAVIVALKDRPISDAAGMVANGNAVFWAARDLLFSPEPKAIVYEMENQTGVELIEVKRAEDSLYPRGPFPALRPAQGETVSLFWRLTASAMVYGMYQHWLVKSLVDSSGPRRCFTCNCNLHGGIVLFHLPDGSSPRSRSKRIVEAASDNQLELRYFCNRKCERSERRWLKEAKRKHKTATQLLSQRQPRASP